MFLRQIRNRMVPWSLRGLGPFLNKYGDSVFFRGVLRTPPLETNPSAQTSIHSAVPHRYVLAYLTAMKSYLRYSSDVMVFVHDDGSLTEEDKLLIRDHIRGVRVIDRGWADAGFRDRSGDDFLAGVRSSYTSYLKLFDPTWVSDKDRLIVVDTDVLFLGKPAMIVEWTKTGGQAWYHRSLPWTKPASNDGPGARAASHQPPSGGGTHIQQAVLARLPSINEDLGRHYQFGRGFNSGFIGYDRGMVDYGELGILLRHLHAKFGTKIFRWGSEQTVHGLVLCGQGAKPLPAEEYMVFTKLSYKAAKSATFVHFIGPFRFYRMLYPRLGARLIRELKTI